MGHRRGGDDYRALQEETLLPAGCGGLASVLISLLTLGFGGFVLTGAVHLGG